MYIMVIVLFIIGVICGSIFTKIGLRVPQNESIFEKSKCPSCEHELSFLDQIPLLSYIVQKGRCKYCFRSIGVIYPIVELATGILFSMTYLSFQYYESPFFQVLLGLVFISSLIIILITDIKYMLIPNKYLIVFASIVLVLHLFIGVKNEELVSFLDIGYEIIIMAIEAGIMFLIMLVIKQIGKIIFKKDVLGGGDVKMMAYVAMLLGYKLSIVIIFFGSFIALPVFIYNAYRKSETLLPFGPFLAIATIIIYLCKVDFNSLIELIH